MKLFRQIAVLIIGFAMSSLVFASSHNGQSIAQIAAANKDFSTLVAALKAAGLAKVLSEPGKYTVFAPTNEAFAKLPEGTLKKLLMPENKDKLVAILKYHVVDGKVMKADVKPGKVKTLEGSDITVSVKDGKVMLNDSAEVTATDIKASNGVIHVINAVLIPPKK